MTSTRPARRSARRTAAAPPTATGRAATSRAATARAATVSAAAVALLLSGCSLVFEGEWSKRTTADATVAEAVTAVEMTDGRSGDVEVVPGSGPGVRVQRTVRYRGDTAPRPTQQVRDGVLSFAAGCAGNCRIDYRLEVPAGAKVKLRTSSGDIKVTGVAEADLYADSGAVRADAVAGPVRIRTSSGSITASALVGPTADIRTDSGDARVAFTTAPTSVTARASSGDVTLTVPPAGPYRVEASTDSGIRDITVPTAPTAPHTLKATTSSGDLHITTT
ncbi:DUF4097 family beta strand repeat-containing protein [Streptomyces bambusae]|uniref:DUF4097 family beta strand repeat protein n=1 Tax=Streptomyces bambusae TaxID=1550616 RepID=A0ABS6ZBL6_9ACTN|nr:DUF4097 family beta strand repeat-containing protein [Streptomyces bambusae]MBW5484623.1 DUF4097 family beta strand repeat protein [Streptomyces bambusae]